MTNIDVINYGIQTGPVLMLRYGPVSRESSVIGQHWTDIAGWMEYGCWRRGIAFQKDGMGEDSNTEMNKIWMEGSGQGRRAFFTAVWWIFKVFSLTVAKNIMMAMTTMMILIWSTIICATFLDLSTIFDCQPSLNLISSHPSLMPVPLLTPHSCLILTPPASISHSSSHLWTPACTWDAPPFFTLQEISWQTVSNPLVISH